MGTDPQPVEADAGAAVEVLVVEDNPGDVRLAREAFGALDRPVTLTIAEDGRTALEELRSRSDLPSLVLLDLDMPELDGRQFLQEVKEDPPARPVPVVVFSSSADPVDVTETYTTHANAYVTKPDDADEFFRAIRNLDAFWFSTAALPGGAESA
jgi:CheY-like chemotaxis protein